MKYKFFLPLFFLFSTFVEVTHAAVVMTGTRIVYPSSLKEKTVQFKNPDAHPYVIQLQITEENGELNNSSPFSLVPPVFRMEPYSGQSARLIFSGRPLPQDRESVFYLDFTQLPALKASEKSQNQLIIAVRNRVKVFYRPESLVGPSSEAYKSLIFSMANGKLNVENPTGFYISLRKAEISVNGQHTILADSVMLPPFTKVQWPLKGKEIARGKNKIKMVIVNDYGTDIIRETTL